MFDNSSFPLFACSFIYYKGLRRESCHKTGSFTRAQEKLMSRSDRQRIKSKTTRPLVLI
uniref:Uncharacterized protein n=1 Tax=Rhizophagus irregularis (strain DAOM 181602 / DAOM 197198 / MUCL 43194) TaxID=747089 RepID=U9TGE8_RHIID